MVGESGWVKFQCSAQWKSDLKESRSWLYHVEKIQKVMTMIHSGSMVKQKKNQRKTYEENYCKESSKIFASMWSKKKLVCFGTGNK